QTALPYCQDDQDLYLSLLQNYLSEKPGKKARLCHLYDKKDAKGYAILIHALKSSSQLIGALSLYEKARDLEKAAKAEDWTYLEEHHVNFLTGYEALTASLEDLLPARDKRDKGDIKDKKDHLDLQQPGSTGNRHKEIPTETLGEQDKVLEFFPVNGEVELPPEEKILEFFPAGEKIGSSSQEAKKTRKEEGKA
ncbi:MAG: Hpt domain-containing protein, partial [Blautia sp.]|nr:Hpt domain-containing protein [Blautia sp.]